MPAVLPAIGAFFATDAGAAVGAGLAAGAVGAGVSALTAPKAPHIGIPPPPGAAMISPAGSAAAAGVRRRQAIAGGLDSTITGAGNAPQSTSGGKTLLGE